MDLETFMNLVPSHEYNYSTEEEMTDSERRLLEKGKIVEQKINQNHWSTIKQLLLDDIRESRNMVTGLTHHQHLDLWETTIMNDDIHSLKRFLTGLNNQEVQMRDVIPSNKILTK